MAAGSTSLTTNIETINKTNIFSYRKFKIMYWDKKNNVGESYEGNKSKLLTEKYARALALPRALYYQRAPAADGAVWISCGSDSLRGSLRRKTWERSDRCFPLTNPHFPRTLVSPQPSRGSSSLLRDALSTEEHLSSPPPLLDVRLGYKSAPSASGPTVRGLTF